MDWAFFLFLFLNHVKDAALSRVKRFFFMFSAKNSIVFTLTIRLCDPFWVNVYVCSDFIYCVWIFNYLSSIYCKDILSHWFTLLPLLNATELKYTKSVLLIYIIIFMLLSLEITWYLFVCLSQNYFGCYRSFAFLIISIRFYFYFIFFLDFVFRAVFDYNKSEQKVQSFLV